jgi:hypothetical protein
MSNPANKPVVTLVRKHEEDGGTWGRLVCKEYGIELHTLEQNWEDNKRSVSCIPAGTYNVRATQSARFGRKMYLVEGVAERDGIRIHPANFPAELQGCIALGTSLGRTGKGRMLLNSRAAVARFEAVLGFNQFTLVVTATPAP